MNNENVDRNFLTDITGDVFADTGGRVIQFLSNLPQFKKSSILDLIKFMTDVYINTWNCNVYGFFLNSPITQSGYTYYEFEGQKYSNLEIKALKLSDEQKNQARRQDRKITKTIEYYESLVDETAPFAMGSCWITGRKTKLFKAGRHNLILAGSGTFVNFHPHLQNGLYVSKEILIRHFFVPFGVKSVGGIDTIITSNNGHANDYYVFQNCIENLDKLKKGEANGPLKSHFSHPSSALFSFIDHYVSKERINNNNPDVGAEQTSLSLVRFNNGKTPDIKVFDFNNMAFRFYLQCVNNLEFKDHWHIFLQKHYDRRPSNKLNFNDETNRWEKAGEPIPFEEFASWKNLVLHNLLYSISIRDYIYHWSEKGYAFPLELMKLYQVSIQNMKPETVDLLNRLAEFIGKHKPELIKKDVELLKSAASSRELRVFLIKVQERAFWENNSQGIFSMEELANLLMPSTRYWGETRDLLLICIFQKSIKS